VGGVDDEVEDDLVEFSGEAGDAGQVGLEILDDIGDVFPLVGGEDEGIFDGLVEVGGDFFAAAAMGEITHGVDNAGDATDAFEGLFDGAGGFGDEEIQIALAELLLQFGGKLGLAVLSLTAERRRWCCGGGE